MKLSYIFDPFITALEQQLSENTETRLDIYSPELLNQIKSLLATAQELQPQMHWDESEDTRRRTRIKFYCDDEQVADKRCEEQCDYCIRFPDLIVIDDAINNPRGTDTKL